MKIAVDGSSNLSDPTHLDNLIVSVLYSSDSPAPDGACRDAGTAIANAGHELLIMPGDGMSLIAKAYKAAGGKRITMLFPEGDDFGTGHVDQYRGLADDLVTDLSWPEANSEITKRADIVVVMGIGPGALIELGFVKYNYKFFKKPQKLILVNDVALPQVLEKCYEQLELPIEKVASAAELFL